MSFQKTAVRELNSQYVQLSRQGNHNHVLDYPKRRSLSEPWQVASRVQMLLLFSFATYKDTCLVYIVCIVDVVVK